MHNWKIMPNFATANTKHDGVLAHLVERNTGSVEVSGSSPLYSTIKSAAFRNQVKSGAFLPPTPQVPIAKGACILIPPAASKSPKLQQKSTHGNKPQVLALFQQANSNSCYLLKAVATSTATATVQPTIGLLPIPRKPIISTCAGTDDEPAN